jgi:hypothetical protein
MILGRHFRGKALSRRGRGAENLRRPCGTRFRFRLYPGTAAVGLSHAADSRLEFGGFLLDRRAEDLFRIPGCAEMKKPSSHKHDKKAEALGHNRR